MREFKIGQRAWSLRSGWGVITDIRPGTYSVVHNGENYTADGRFNLTDKFPTLFHNEVPADQWPNPEPPPEPLPNLEVDAKIWVKGFVEPNWLARHFCKWEESSSGVCCWAEGKTSFTGSVTAYFPFWRLDDGRTNYPDEVKGNE